MAAETTTSQPPVPFLKLKEIAHEVRIVHFKPSTPWQAVQFKTHISSTNSTFLAGD
jgi:hypothetical protein